MRTHRLSSYRCLFARKYSVRVLVLLTHCTALFMKHVLPKLLSPVAPLTVGPARNNPVAIKYRVMTK